MNKKMSEYILATIDAIKKIPRDKVDEAIKMLKEHKGRVFTIGNGGSAATASHFANDLEKMCHFDVECLSDHIPLITAYANDLSYDQVYARQFSNKFISKDDILITLSASGNSPNILNAIDVMNTMGGKTINLLSFDGGKTIDKKGLHILIPLEKGQYGVAEDMHSIICHMIANILKVKE